MSFTPTKPPKTNNEYSRRSREVVRGGLSGQCTDHSAHTQHHTRLLYHGVSAGNNTAAGAQRRGQAGTNKLDRMSLIFAPAVRVSMFPPCVAPHVARTLLAPPCFACTFIFPCIALPPDAAVTRRRAQVYGEPTTRTRVFNVPQLLERVDASLWISQEAVAVDETVVEVDESVEADVDESHLDEESEFEMDEVRERTAVILGRMVWQASRHVAVEDLGLLDLVFGLRSLLQQSTVTHRTVGHHPWLHS